MNKQKLLTLVLSVSIIAVLVGAVSVQAQDGIGIEDVIVTMVVDDIDHTNLVSVVWVIENQVDVVDAYFTGSSANPGTRRQFELASITGEEGPLLAMTDDMVVVSYTVTGFDRARQRQIELASITGENPGITYADVFFEHHGLLILHRAGSMVVVENRSL